MLYRGGSEDNKQKRNKEIPESVLESPIINIRYMTIRLE